MNKPQFGFNVIGYITANLDQGVAARNTVRRLLDCGFNVACVDLDPGNNRWGQDKTYSHLIVKDENPAPFSINIFHMNPPEFKLFLRSLPQMFKLDNRLNVCIPFWELERIPREWVQPLELMDLILAPTKFIKHAVASSISNVAIRSFVSAAFLPDFTKIDKQSLGVNKDSVVFVYSFDVSSESERKNPWAAIQAFEETFSNNDNVNLIIKLNGQGTEGFDLTKMKLSKRVQNNRLIKIIDHKLSYPEIIALYDCCDVYISLHRGEGLGLGLMEAMLLGKPVIGTAYSGNMDFMDDSNSCLVNYKLIPLPEESVNHYSKNRNEINVRWADADITEAGVWMRRLVNNKELRTKIGKKAQDSQLSRQSRNEIFYTLNDIATNKNERFAGAIRKHNKRAPSQSIRILFQNRPCSYQVPGGDTVVMNRLKEQLTLQNVQVDFCSDYYPDLSSYDLVHIFNLTVPHYTEAFARNAHNNGVPFVVTTLQEDFTQYQYKASFATRMMIMYLEKKQRPVVLELGIQELKNLPNAANHTSLLSGTFAQTLLACGATEKKRLNKLFPNTSVDIIPFGSTVKDIDIGPELFINQYGVKDFVLCVGRMESRKNQLMLLAALEHDDIPLVFCIGATSANSTNSEYMRLCKTFERKGKTIFVEKLSDEMLVSAYRAAKVHCLPSWYELPGLVTLEAAYYGCNVVASSWGAIGDYAGKEDCWFIEPDDPITMRQVVLEALAAPRGVRSSARIKEYTWERSATATLEVYKRVIKKNRLDSIPTITSFLGEVMSHVEKQNYSEALRIYGERRNQYTTCDQLKEFDELMKKLSEKLRHK
jgi:glycosyltransferase involved in cell wall biosynthesis